MIKRKLSGEDDFDTMDTSGEDRGHSGEDGWALVERIEGHSGEDSFDTEGGSGVDVF